ncbi:MAG: queuosine precursor transporter [bacterium]
MINALLFFGWTLVVIAGVLGAFRFFGRAGVYGVLAIYIILANIFVVKQITLFGIAATGGNSLYGALFLATDLISEYWGKKEAQKAVWFGWFAAFTFLVATQVFILFIPSGDDFADEPMRRLFALTPRIVAASLIAYLISQTHDVFAYHMWMRRTQGRHLWLRNNASTWVSQLIDSAVFSSIAFLGVFPLNTVIQIFASTYLLKVIVAALDTPFIYLSKRWLPAELLSKQDVT